MADIGDLTSSQVLSGEFRAWLVRAIFRANSQHSGQITSKHSRPLYSLVILCNESPQEPKKGINIKNCQTPPPPPKDPWTRKFFMVGASFPFKMQEKGLQKEFRGGGSLGAPKLFMLNFFGACFCTWSPSFRGFAKGWFPKGWSWRMFPGTKNRNEGTFGCSPAPKTGTRVHTDVFRGPKNRNEAAFAKNGPFMKPPFCVLLIWVFWEPASP